MLSQIYLSSRADLLSKSLSPTSRYTYCFRPEFHKLATGLTHKRAYGLLVAEHAVLSLREEQELLAAGRLGR